MFKKFITGLIIALFCIFAIVLIFKFVFKIDLTPLALAIIGIK